MKKWIGGAVLIGASLVAASNTANASAVCSIFFPYDTKPADIQSYMDQKLKELDCKEGDVISVSNTPVVEGIFLSQYYCDFSKQILPQGRNLYCVYPGQRRSIKR